jgi:hypothetical protein
MNHDLMLCVHCRRPVGFRFRDYNDVGFLFHWVKNYYFVDVVLFVEGCKPLVLFREAWVLDAKGAKRPEQRF